MKSPSYVERKYIDTLVKRMEYLKERIEQNRRIGRPTSFDEHEHNAVQWALAKLELYYGSSEETNSNRETD